MAEEFETIELEYSEDDILYYIEDEDGNEIGFALEEGGKEVEYYYEGFNAYFWSSTEYGNNYAYNMYLYYSDDDANLDYSNYDKYVGFSVRCLKD